MTPFRLAVPVAILTVAATAPVAQEMSDDELLRRFQSQRDAFTEAQASPLGQARGLRLITADAPETEAAVAPVISGAALESAQQEGETVVAVSETPQKVEPIGVFAAEMQVNVRIEFGFDSAALSDDQLPKLAQLCRVMQSSDVHLFRILGHTDASGSDEYNQKLSELRAQEVMRYFLNDCGIDAARLEAVGLGERFLSNAQTPDAPENRRVEFQAMS